MGPKVSVVMSVFNGSRYLHKSIESVLNQSFTDFEFVIIDDCSEDSTFEILSSFAKKDKRIEIIRNESNMGLTKSLNKALGKINGPYVARIDADDMFLTNKLESQLEFMTENDSLISFTNCEMIDSCGNKMHVHYLPFDEISLKWSMIFRNAMRHSTAMWKRKEVEKIGLYDENYKYAQDYEFWTRLMESNSVGVVHQILSSIRMHENTITQCRIKDQDSYVTMVAKRQINRFIKREVSDFDAKNMRYIYMHRHGLQIREMESITAPSFSKYLLMYFELVSEFRKKNSDDLIVEREVVGDLSSFLDFFTEKNSWIEAMKAESKRANDLFVENIVQKVTGKYEARLSENSTSSQL